MVFLGRFFFGCRNYSYHCWCSFAAYKNKIEIQWTWILRQWRKEKKRWKKWEWNSINTYLIHPGWLLIKLCTLFNDTENKWMLNNFRQAFRINDFFMCFFFLSLIQFYKIIESFLMGPFICNLMDEKRFSSYLFCVVFFCLSRSRTLRSISLLCTNVDSMTNNSIIIQR